MVRGSKWIKLRSPRESTRQVAARALEGRLETVWRLLRRAAREQESDKRQEYVHQLRVSTRRALTALDLFARLVPRRHGKWFRKQLKKTRRAANDARDFDVLLTRLAMRRGDNVGGDRLTTLLAKIHQQRQVAQRPITEALARLRGKQYRRRVRKLVDKVEFGAVRGGRFVSFAQRQMRQVLQEFRRAGEEDLHDIENLHQFRIAGKRLRYAMEILSSAFPEEFRQELYPVVVALQEQLGAINDHACAQRRFEAWLTHSKDDPERQLLSEIIATEAEAVTRLQNEFVVEWTAERAQDLARRFDAVLEAAAMSKPSGAEPLAAHGGDEGTKRTA